MSGARAGAWAGLVWISFLGLVLADGKQTMPFIELRFKSEMRDELELYSADRAIRKIQGVKKTEGSWREKRLRVEIDPAATVPVAEVGRAVRTSGHELKEMIVECPGVYSREGYKNMFRSEPGGVVFQLAVGEKTRELEKLSTPSRVRIRGRVSLEKLASPFALVVLSYTVD